jgi:hypothetical protein
MDDEKIMTVKDLIQFLRKLPEDAEIFAYSGLGGFFSLDTPEELAMWFKLNEDGTVLELDHARYMKENRDRLAAGKEWIDYC